MTHPQTQDDEALEAMRFAIMVEMFTTVPHELTSKTAERYATAALTALRNYEGRKG
jgi:hypothetical protein